MEILHKDLQEQRVKVIGVTKQNPSSLREYASSNGITFDLVSIDHSEAVLLGVALAAEKDANGEPLADEAFWNEAPCRTIMVVGPNGVIEFIEQLMDQAKQPNYDAAKIVVTNLQ